MGATGCLDRMVELFRLRHCALHVSKIHRKRILERHPQLAFQYSLPLRSINGDHRQRYSLKLFGLIPFIHTPVPTGFDLPHESTPPSWSRVELKEGVFFAALAKEDSYFLRHVKEIISEMEARDQVG